MKCKLDPSHLSLANDHLQDGCIRGRVGLCCTIVDLFFHDHPESFTPPRRRA